MRLLICTQIVDYLDPSLGFFHCWLEELAKHFKFLTVICLKRGKFNLPANVRVLSLGKETGRSRLKYLWRFYRYIWQERRHYDAVFVHMNQEYVLLGGLFWKLWGKKIYLWRNHYAGSWLTDFAAMWCAKVFCTSRYSYTAKYKKTVTMPVGFDPEALKNLPEVSRVPRSILVIGRFSPSKNIHLIVEALGMLHRAGVQFTADFYGPTEPKDEPYRRKVVKRSQELNLDRLVNFYPAVPKTETKFLYAAHEIVVNASPSGMLDKTIFSAMGHGCLVLVSNPDLVGQIPPVFIFDEGNADNLARELGIISKLSVSDKQYYARTLREFVFKSHSLPSLVTRLFKHIA